MQQLGLQRYGHVSDLIQQENTTISQLEFTAFFAFSPGKRTLFMTKKFALEQSVRQGGTVDLEKRAAGPRRLLIKILSNNFLTYTAFTTNQDVESRIRHMADQIPDSFDGLADANDFWDSLFYFL